MPSNDASVAGQVTYQSGDDITESNLTKRAAKTNSSDYVERGLGFAVDSGAGTVTIGNGYAIVRDGTQAYEVEPDQATDVTLPDASGVNYVYLALEPGTDNSIYYHLDTDKSAPTDPALYIGQVDGSDGSSTEQNRRPDVELGDTDIDRLVAALDANGQDINNVGSFSTEQASITEVVGKASLGTDQTVPTATVTKLNLDTVDIETTDAAVVDVDLSNNKLVAKKAGKYLINANVVWDGSANWSGDETLQTDIFTGGSRLNNERNVHPGVNTQYSVGLTATADLSADSDIDMRVFHNRGGDETIGGDTLETYLEVVRVG